MDLDIRQILWGSASAIADHLKQHSASHRMIPLELEVKFNGAALPHVARHYAKVVTSGDLPGTARILDMGCGYGRIAVELSKHLRERQCYVGLDPNAEAIDWARANISTSHPNFSFEQIDIRSLPYNPGGQLNGTEFRFPFEDGSLDLIFMVSVLTHVDLSTVETYAREASRTLKPETGRLLSTIFLLDDEVDALMAQGQSSFTFPWPHGPSRVENRDNPELAIAHPRQAVLDILAAAGFAQVTVVNGHWSGRSAPALDYQDLLVADRTTGSAYRHPEIPAPAPLETDRFPQVLLDRVQAEGFRSRDELLGFTTWSASLSLNVLWWQAAGFTLAVAGAGSEDAEPVELGLAGFRQLGIPFPQTVDSSDATSFHPVDDAGIVDLLSGAGVIASSHELLACMLDAATNGFVLLDAARAGKQLVLLSSGCAPRAAPIPLFEISTARP